MPTETTNNIHGTNNNNNATLTNSNNRNSSSSGSSYFLSSGWDVPSGSIFQSFQSMNPDIINPNPLAMFNPAPATSSSSPFIYGMNMDQLLLFQGSNGFP
eukprot:CAMPEP_0175040916 /NCGR_PEP_ID=MMETSP0052_2-20121109/1578_1 /TAXON_ID=51329 ORGANISM="Polytomella parva, Strain SAG 63-3" /NCGR_SAMPLE_ID=MMETSP0052_2 /ASSEMBLY_ACC=CAM_ASM_000194 /LENGTH=99 /DNA_ID=CAMNT_0016303279 /DNA_START=157 /DNA_END=456 /DNA_ORIENTATION=+